VGAVRSLKLFNADSGAEVKKLLSVTEVTTTIDPKKLYRVQIGAYSVKANADAMLKKVKAAGFKDAFIKYS